jgi:hypothetical protein
MSGREDEIILQKNSKKHAFDVKAKRHVLWNKNCSVREARTDHNKKRSGDDS